MTPGTSRIQVLREALGQAHYERMRRAMASAIILPAWEELVDGTREAHRQQLDFLIPALLVAERELAS